MKSLLTLCYLLCSIVALCQDKVAVKVFFTKDDEETDETFANYYSVGNKIGEKGFWVDTVYSFYLPSNNNESLRLVRMMDNWHPAFLRGRPVKSKFVLPLTFKLS